MDSARGAWILCSLFAVGFPVFVGFPTIFEAFGRDQGIHATIGAALREGLLPYRDVYNVKPPMTTPTHLLALELFGHSMRSIRILDLIFVALTSFGIVHILRKLGRPPVMAVGSVFAFCAIYYSLDLWSRAQTDGWAAFLMVPMLYLMLIAWERQSDRVRAVVFMLAGVLMGIAFWYKYTVIAAGALIFVPLLERSGARFYWRDLVWFIGGGLIMLFGMLALMAALGMLMPFIDIQSYIRGYVALFDRSFVGPIQLTGLDLWHLTIAVCVVAGWVVLLSQLMRRREDPLPILVAIWAIAGWLSPYAQNKGFHYHYLPMLIPHAILVGLVFEAAWRRAEARGDRRSGNLSILCLLALLYGATPVLPRVAAVTSQLLPGGAMPAQPKLIVSYPQTKSLSSGPLRAAICALKSWNALTS
ncbi:MAG: glycosyltransferase family 39 protein [Pseudomonadota bacterium]